MKLGQCGGGMVSKRANDILLAEGHNNGGLCSRCWSEAATLYANGQGAYESQTAAYYAVMERAQKEALERVAGVT